MFPDVSASPLVSVVVPAYNAARTLDATLASIVAQTYSPIEIVIVDDGSDDATAAIARTFCKGEPRARLIRQANLGVAAARNAAIAVTSGAFVAPIDADDLWHPTYLSAAVARAMAMGSAPGLVFAWYRRIDAAGDIIHSGHADVIEGQALQRMAFRNLVGNGSGMVIARAALLEAGCYDSRLRAQGVEGTEDFLLQLVIASRWPVASVPAYLVGYRSMPGAMSCDAARMFASKRLALSLYAERRPDRPLLGQTWRWVLAKRRLLDAYGSFAEGHRWAALCRILSALLLDPRATIAMIRDYSARQRKPTLEAGLRINFVSADSTSPISGYGGGSLRPASLALEERRLSALAHHEAGLFKPNTRHCQTNPH